VSDIFSIEVERLRFKGVAAACAAAIAKLPPPARLPSEPSPEELVRIQEAAFGHARYGHPENAALIESALAART
jgi:hypothetical protein